MRPNNLLVALVCGLIPATAGAGDTRWRQYVIPQTGACSGYPGDHFYRGRGAAGWRHGTAFFHKGSSGRSDRPVRSQPREHNSPATLLAKRHPPAEIQYKRVTSRFFAVSSIRNGRTWYNRCNRANEYMNCVLINYPAAEDRQWDAVVTRISLSLTR